MVHLHLPVMPNGSYGVGVIAWDPTGLIKLGQSALITIQVANGTATPTPTPVVSATPTPSASPTPSSVQPLGVVAPSGKNWLVVADDEFNQDTSINSTLWNGGTGGGFVDTFCSGATTSLGYTGNDCANYFRHLPGRALRTGA